MKIAFNPSTVAALTSPPDNKDITFDLRGHNIFTRGVKFQGTDTNTWRDIKINNVSIGSNVLDLRNGSNTTLTNTDGVVTINSTWRPVVDNLISDSTTSSLSANQGRVLAGLINGKSDSDHNHDGRYLRLSGQDTMLGNLYLYSYGTSYIGKGLGDKSGADFTEANIVIRSWWGISFKSFDDVVRTYIDTRTGNIGTKGVLNAVGAVIQGRVYNGGDDEGIIIKPASNGYAGLILGTHDGERSIFYFVKNKPFWRYSHGSDNLDIIHPKKSGTIALTSDIPLSLKNPYALTISLNGTSQGPYDGSAAKNINITPSSIGAATSDHNHDGRYVYNYGGTANVNGQALNQNALFMSTTSGITKDQWHILQAAWNDEYRWNSQIAFPTQNRNGMYYRSGLDDNTAWGAWVKLLDTNNYSSILDSRYYTESEINSLLDAKLNRQNLSYGTWNPRGYNLAADYCYNGGDLSISENSNKIFVSIDGSFWQNEGQYRVLDTSDVASLKGDLTVHQYLSNTDTTWYPLIWGGSSHNDTSDSTGAVYKSHDKLSWQTSSQTLYTTHLRTTYIDLENNRGIFQVTSKDTSPFKGIKLPDLQSNGIGIFSKVGDGNDEGGIVLSKDTCVIYNSFDTGWGLSVRDKDLKQTDISSDDTVAFGIRQNYKLYSRGGFEKSGSDNSYVLLGGGDHKLESALNVANADKVDGYHYNDFTYKRYIGFNRNGPYNIKVFSVDTSSLTWGAYYLIFDIFSNGYSNNRVYFGRYEVSLGHWNNTDKNPTVYSRWIFKTNSAYDCVHVVKDLSSYKVDVYIENSLQDCNMGLSIVASSGFNMISSSPWVNLPSASSTVQLIGTTYLSFMGNADMLDGYHENSFLRYRGSTSINQEATLWSQIGIKEYYGALPDGLTNIYNQGGVISLSGIHSRFEIYASDNSSSGSGLYYRTGWNDTKRSWLKFIDSSNIGSQSVNYANSAGNADTLDGEHASSFVRAGHYESADLNSLDPYSFIRSVYSNVAGTSPNGNTGWYNVIQLVHRNGASDGPSYIGQIALGMTTNTNDMFFRGKRTDPWKTVIHSGNYTKFVSNYYWANVKISTSSNTQTQPSVNTIYANNWFRSQGDSGWYNESYGGGIWMNDSNWIKTYGGKSFYCDNQIYSSNSIKMSNILLEHTNEINSASGLHLNYRTPNNVTLCIGGGNVGISNSSPSYKLDVNGQMRASGFHHSSMDSNNYMLLAGGGYKSFGGDYNNPIFLGYLNLDHGDDGTISSSFYCLGYSVPFTYTRGGNYCKISIPNTTHQVFYIKAAIASVNYSGNGMDTWVGVHRNAGAWWLHCYASGANEVRVKGFSQTNSHNDSWWGGNPLYSYYDGANKITVCIFGYVTFK